VIEKNSIWGGRKKKEPKNQEISSFSMGFFFLFFFWVEKL
jgi:hypothetical protein